MAREKNNPDEIRAGKSSQTLSIFSIKGENKRFTANCKTYLIQKSSRKVEQFSSWINDSGYASQRNSKILPGFYPACFKIFSRYFSPNLLRQSVNPHDKPWIIRDWCAPVSSPSTKLESDFIGNNTNDRARGLWKGIIKWVQADTCYLSVRRLNLQSLKLRKMSESLIAARRWDLKAVKIENLEKIVSYLFLTVDIFVKRV